MSKIETIIMISFLLFSFNSYSQSWKTIEVTYSYDPEFDNRSISFNWRNRKFEKFETKTIKVRIPSDLKKGEMIKGVIPFNRSFEDFAYKNRFAMYDNEGNKPYGGPHKTMLKELAKLTKHPEIEHAGAVLYGTSNNGRFAAHFAHFWPERVLAVILDHSWTRGVPLKKVSGYEYGQLPIAEGVPYFFNASQKDAHSGANRRALHYAWCTKAYKMKHPCTSVISYEDVGHNDPGDRTLQGVWLEEVIKLRVPEIPSNGIPYKLIPVNPKSTGGAMSVKIVTEGKVSHYTNVKVGPKVSRSSFWVPGPLSAALTVEWLKKNNAKILKDESGKIK